MKRIGTYNMMGFLSGMLMAILAFVLLLKGYDNYYWFLVLSVVFSVLGFLVFYRNSEQIIHANISATHVDRRNRNELYVCMNARWYCWDRKEARWEAPREAEDSVIPFLEPIE